MNVSEAKKIALNYIRENMIPVEGDSYVIVDSGVKEGGGGWYFPYQSEKFLKTGDIDFSLVGNWPIFVNREGVCLGARVPESA